MVSQYLRGVNNLEKGSGGDGGVGSLFRPTQQQTTATEGTDIMTARSYGRGDQDLQASPVITNKKKVRGASIYNSQETQYAIRLSQIKQFCNITLENSTAVSNQKFGIGVLGFFGTMTIKNTTINENETDGMVFAKNANDPCLLNRNEMLDDEAQYLDYAADYTERSNNPNA